MFCLLRLPVQHRGPRCLLNAAAPQAGQVLQRHDPADGRHYPLLPRRTLLGGNSLRLQTQQLQHVPHARHDVGRGSNCYPCLGRVDADPSNAVANSTSLCNAVANPTIRWQRCSSFRQFLCNSVAPSTRLDKALAPSTNVGNAVALITSLSNPVAPSASLGNATDPYSTSYKPGYR